MPPLLSALPPTPAQPRAPPAPKGRKEAWEGGPAQALLIKLKINYSFYL